MSCPWQVPFMLYAGTLFTPLIATAQMTCADLRTPSDKLTTNVPTIVPDQLLHKSEVKYPKEARKEKIEGTVVLQVTIERDGKVSNVSVKLGNITLAEAAVDAVREWRFEPCTKDGLPIRVQQSLEFTFHPDRKIADFNRNLDPPTEVPDRAPEVHAQNADRKIYRVGGGVTPPKAIFSPDPEYDNKARKAKYQGTCLLSMIVGTDGLPYEVKVARALGKGLDEKAVEAVTKWRFQPAMKDGQPVPVQINVEVSFRLY
jgi:TonB family protein